MDDIESTSPDTGPAVRRVYGGSIMAKSTNRAEEYRFPALWPEIAIIRNP
jgi:hypothetical protein